MAIFAPSFASRTAVARPMPRAPPVTRAILPASELTTAMMHRETPRPSATDRGPPRARGPRPDEGRGFARKEGFGRSREAQRSLGGASRFREDQRRVVSAEAHRVGERGADGLGPS